MRLVRIGVRRNDQQDDAVAADIGYSHRVGRLAVISVQPDDPSADRVSTRRAWPLIEVVAHPMHFTIGDDTISDVRVRNTADLFTLRHRVGKAAIGA